MATYEELLAQYNAISPWRPYERNQFLQEHPKFAQRYSRGGFPGGRTGAEGIPEDTSMGPPGPGPGQTPQPPVGPPEAPPEAPPAPPVPAQLAADGWSYVWDPETKQWVLTQTGTPEEEDPYADTPGGKRGVRAALRSWISTNFLPEQVEPIMAFLEGALTEGKPYEQIIAELQETQFFKDAYPELGIRKLKGLHNVSLDYIRDYRDRSKGLAKAVFGTSVTNDQIANLIGNNVSLDEFQHRLGVFKKIEQFGGPVRAFFEEGVGVKLGDEDLYEWFDPEITTQELDDAYNDARVRGMPVLFGLKPRSQAEADAYRMLGLDPDEVIERFRTVGENASRFQRLASIEQNILTGLPEDFGAFLKDVPNDLLVQAEVFQNPAARARIQDLISREIARFKQGGGPAATGGGQLVGLLGQEERASYG